MHKWVGQELLGHPNPKVVGEVRFLKRLPFDQSDQELEPKRKDREGVGNIDSILVHPDGLLLSWCALEIQAVYFSGDSMTKDFKDLSEGGHVGVPFPAGRRSLDYRSSGPKRLMPQLQTKIPTLRRWGKRMAVVVDEVFFSKLGPMDSVPDVSNCDIAWFVVGFDETDEGDAHLVKRKVQFTTLERAVEGLTAGQPVTLTEFEDRLREKIKASSSHNPFQLAADD